MGPRCSFVLWEQAVAVIGDAIDRGIAAQELNLVFAGGIHDARSAALVCRTRGAAGGAAGVKVGVLVGNRLSVHTRGGLDWCDRVAVPGEVVRCKETVLLESGPGHQVRVSRTPFVPGSKRRKQRLLAERRSAEEIRDALEGLNVGRLRVATKGRDRGQGRVLCSGR